MTPEMTQELVQLESRAMNSLTPEGRARLYFLRDEEGKEINRAGHVYSVLLDACKFALKRFEERGLYSDPVALRLRDAIYLADSDFESKTGALGTARRANITGEISGNSATGIGMRRDGRGG